mmetsp:Transcript_16050/g.30827  ORF Transcript_16050/g.30827 Transcript_16050/m.30827 type:complete len:379 (-) Transcript_16050:529-1665(-)
MFQKLCSYLQRCLLVASNVQANLPLHLDGRLGQFVLLLLEPPRVIPKLLLVRVETALILGMGLLQHTRHHLHRLALAVRVLDKARAHWPLRPQLRVPQLQVRGILELKQAAPVLLEVVAHEGAHVDGVRQRGRLQLHGHAHHVPKHLVLGMRHPYHPGVHLPNVHADAHLHALVQLVRAADVAGGADHVQAEERGAHLALGVRVLQLGQLRGGAQARRGQVPVPDGAQLDDLPLEGVLVYCAEKVVQKNHDVDGVDARAHLREAHDVNHDDHHLFVALGRDLPLGPLKEEAVVVHVALPRQGIWVEPNDLLDAVPEGALAAAELLLLLPRHGGAAHKRVHHHPRQDGAQQLLVGAHGAVRAGEGEVHGEEQNDRHPDD